MIPLLPVVIGTAPLILVGAKAAEEAALGVPAGKLAENGMARIARLYGAQAADPADPIFGPRTGYGMLIAAAVAHLAFRAAGLSGVRLARNVKLA